MEWITFLCLKYMDSTRPLPALPESQSTCVNTHGRSSYFTYVRSLYTLNIDFDRTVRGKQAGRRRATLRRKVRREEKVFKALVCVTICNWIFRVVHRCTTGGESGNWEIYAVQYVKQTWPFSILLHSSHYNAGRRVLYVLHFYFKRHIHARTRI